MSFATVLTLQVYMYLAVNWHCDEKQDHINPQTPGMLTKLNTHAM